MNLELLNKISYHDAEISNYVRNNNNISFQLRDGWIEDDYYKLELKNIKVQVMNNKPGLICFLLDEFNSINKYNNIDLYSGEFGELDESHGGKKYYLKLWIRHPGDFGIEPEVTMDEYKFDGLDISLCDDYDDTGRLYIKFLMDDINITKYDLLDKYSRVSYENINNLFKYKKFFDEKSFKYFSSLSVNEYIFSSLDYAVDNIVIKYRNIFNMLDIITLKFTGITEIIDNDILNKFSLNIKHNKTMCSGFIRIVECDEDKYVVGLLLSLSEELVFTCSDIVYEGKLLKYRSLLD